MAVRFVRLILFLSLVFGVSLFGMHFAYGSMTCPPTIIDLYLGEPVSMEMVVDDLAKARIVYVGEFHTISRHHELQVEILRGLASRNRNVALAMEMFTAAQQPVVDSWLASKKTVSELIEKLGNDRWTNLTDYHSVLYLARDLGIPIICLNASEQIVRKVSREGFGSLSEEQKSLMPTDVDPINPLYAKLLTIKLKVHRAFQGKTLDRVIYAQALRDAVMARNIAQFLESPQGTGKLLMVIAGNGHLNYGFGIPERVKRHLDVSYRIILPSESGELRLSEAEKMQALDIEISHEDIKFIDRPIADYISVIPIKTDQTDTIAGSSES
jgi:uncharacterized iron-regulated protein